ncbi:MAG: hypothetical protein WDN48_04830 [Pseudolabrys sp.]
MLLSATTISLAQSQPNCGANAPANGDTFGKPFSGTLEGKYGAARCAGDSRRHAHYHRHKHVRYSNR